MDQNNHIYIIGSGGLAREIYFLIQEINKAIDTPYDIKGFIDKQTDYKEIKIGANLIPVVDEDQFLSGKYDGSSVSLGIGNPDLLAKIIRNYEGRFNFPNIVHPGFIGDLDNISFGVGNLITAGCVFTTNIRIGSYNLFNLCTTVGHDTIIGDYNIINPGVNISGGVKISNQNLIGTNATVLQYKTIGSGSVIGAGSLVNKDVESNVVVAGVPAKLLKTK